LAVRHEPVAIALNGVGVFDRRGRIDALWAGLSPHDRLAALHKKIDHAMVVLGLPSEGRAYLPHITLARFGKHSTVPDGFLAKHAALGSDLFEMNAFMLFESHTGKGDTAYEAIKRYPLV
jgi:RNA 2',3'-cyclic 3'-phosphodiesterase